MIGTIVFHAFALLALVSAGVVVFQRNPAYSAFALIVTLCSLAGIFGLLGSPFIAVLQVIVYAGAIMVLFLFVIMLLNLKREERRGSGGVGLAALALGFILVLEIGTVFLSARLGPGSAPFDATTRRMAVVLFSAPYLYVFEATSILILAALVGAVTLAKKEL
jgi:NADH-quinone oxidoreductase subunit J